MDNTSKSLRAALVYFLNLLVAAVGTDALGSPFYHLFHPKTLQAPLVRESFINPVVAFGAGCFVFYRWRPAPAKWIWVSGVCWFGLQVFLTPGGTQRPVFSDVSGVTCFSDPGAVNCSNWVVITIPLLRTVFYSAGAWCSWMETQGTGLKASIRRFAISAVRHPE